MTGEKVGWSACGVGFAASNVFNFCCGAKELCCRVEEATSFKRGSVIQEGEQERFESVAERGVRPPHSYDGLAVVPMVSTSRGRFFFRWVLAS